MQIHEFIEETSRLENYYQREYTEKQREIMFKQLQNLTMQEYKNAIEIAFSKCKFLPRVSELKEFSKCNDKEHKERFKHLYKNLEWCDMNLDEY